MFKKVLPFVVMAFVTACSNSSTGGMACCQGGCPCCGGQGCAMCTGQQGVSQSGDKPCAVCDQAEREWKATHGKAKPSAVKH